MAKLYLVQIKSDRIIEEGKKALIIPMEFDKEVGEKITRKEIHNALIRDAIKLYPQYTGIKDNPIFTISRMTKEEYNSWQKTNILKQKSITRSVN